jgi:hypothetical protein
MYVIGTTRSIVEVYIGPHKSWLRRSFSHSGVDQDSRLLGDSTGAR